MMIQSVGLSTSLRHAGGTQKPLSRQNTPTSPPVTFQGQKAKPSGWLKTSLATGMFFLPLATLATPKAARAEAAATATPVQAADETADQGVAELRSKISQLELQMAQLANQLSLVQSQSYGAYLQKQHVAIEQTKDALFVISAVNKTNQGNSRADSSGWVFKDKNGKLGMITCHHGVHDFYEKNRNFEFEVYLGNGKMFKTTLAKQLPGNQPPLSAKFDLAMLEMPKEPELVEYLEKVALPLPDLINKDVESGTPAMAIGNPFDLREVVTYGVVGVTPTDNSAAKQWGKNSYTFPKRFLNVGINPGNSGGPALAYIDNEWKVVGMTNAKRTAENDVLAYLDPTSVIQVFLQARGFDTVDMANPAAAEYFLTQNDRESGFPRLIGQISDRLIEEVLTGSNKTLHGELTRHNVSREVYVNEMIAPVVKSAVDAIRAENQRIMEQAKKNGQASATTKFLPDLDNMKLDEMSNSDKDFFVGHIRKAVQSPAKPKTTDSKPPAAAAPDERPAEKPSAPPTEEKPPAAGETTGALVDITADQFTREVNESPIPVTVLAGDPGKTQPLADFFNTMAGQHEGKIKFVRISHTEARKAIGGSYNDTSGTPNVMTYLPGGNRKGWFVNPKPGDSLRDWVLKNTR